MNQPAGAGTVLLVGVLLIRLTVSDAYQRYVRTGMGPWLLVAGLLLTGLGAVAVVRAFRGREPAAGDLDAHGHGGSPRAGWLLLAPVLALLLAAPPALGSFAVDRNIVVRSGTGAVFAALPADPAPRSMTLLEFGERAADRDGASLAGATVRLTGFVAAAPAAGDPAGFRLARYQIACCAADAVASVVRVTGAVGGTPPRDAWVVVTGRYAGGGRTGTPTLAAASAEQIAPPVDPYE